MNPIANALSTLIVDMLSSGQAVAIEGFGTFHVRRYRDHGRGARDALPYFVAAPELSKQIEAGATPSGFTAPLLLERLGLMATMPEHEVAIALDAYVSEVVRRVVEAPDRPVAFGRSGVVRIQIKSARTGEPKAPPRRVLSFVASVWLRHQINNRPAPATASSDKVSSVLAAFATALTTADQVIRAADLAGAERSGTSEQALKKIEHDTGAGVPALLGTILTSYDVRSLDKGLPDALLRPDEYPDALAEHRRLMGAKKKPGIPFAREASGDLWCYCVAHGPEVWVFAAGPDEGAVHAHAMTLSAWLGGSLLVAALRRALGDAVLAIDDAEAVLARLHAIAPNADFVLTDLPF